jgi:hypothetical protein
MRDNGDNGKRRLTQTEAPKAFRAGNKLKMWLFFDDLVGSILVAREAATTLRIPLAGKNIPKIIDENPYDLWY